MTFKDAAAAWLVAQCEPLIPTLDRAVAEEAFLVQTRADPTRTAWWFGGVVADHMLTLPPADPWRHLSARADRVMVRGLVPKPPVSTGAVGGNGKFGTVVDGQDLAHPSFADPITDIGLAALASGISAGGAALVAFGSDGWDAAARAALALHAGYSVETRDESKAAGLFFGAGTDALRWAIWRRRAYLGQVDDWTLASGFAWLWRAEELATTGTLPDGEWDEVRRAMEAEQIPPEMYAQIHAG